MEVSVENQNEFASSIDNMMFVVETVATLFTTGQGKESYEDYMVGCNEFVSIVDKMLQDGSINHKSAYIFMDMYLGGLLVPESEKLDDLIDKGVKLNKLEAITEITSGDELFSMVAKKRDEFWKGLNG